MIKIRMLQDTLVEGNHCGVGETVEVTDPVARFLIAIRKAVKAAGDETVETTELPDETEKAVQRRKRRTED